MRHAETFSRKRERLEVQGPTLSLNRDLTEVEILHTFCFSNTSTIPSPPQPRLLPQSGRKEESREGEWQDPGPTGRQVLTPRPGEGHGLGWLESTPGNSGLRTTPEPETTTHSPT